MRDWSRSVNVDAESPADGSLDFAQARSRKRQLFAELEQGGEDAPSPEELLTRWPGDPERDPDVASLLFADYCRRQQTGESASADDYRRQFPQHADSLAGLIRDASVFRSLGLCSGSGEMLRLPVVGEELFDFRLRDELGRGAFARVFLAEQSQLAGRPVVLKVSGIDGDEPQTLAQLQHTNIVPIYSVHEDAGAGLRAVCMPYFGGASLTAVLHEAWPDDAPPPARGEQFVAALDRVGSKAGFVRQAFQPDSSGAPDSQAGKPDVQDGFDRHVLDCLSAMSYVRAAAWVVARIAEGLAHAHQRGVLHRDVKPSNVLIGGDGQPMLLDFNLSHNARAAPERVTLGGTVAYMAPEHLRALAARDPALAKQVDRPADVYSLGMVLFEMLAGQSPFQQSASYSPLPALVEAMALERGRDTPSVRDKRPDVPWGLESILRTCLAPDPAKRYQRAEHLTEDLDRFLNDQPLRYAPELSWKERAQKWARRHPRLTSSASVATAAVVLLALAGAALAGAYGRLGETRESLAVSHAQERRKQYRAGTERALCLVNTTSDVQDHLNAGRTVCEETLALYDVLRRGDWQSHPDWRRLSPPERTILAEDTRELLLMLAWARVRSAPTDDDTLRGALALLERAEAIDLPASPALWHDRAAYLARLGDASAATAARKRAADVPPASPRDHYLLATTLIRGLADAPADAETYRRAVSHLDEAIRLEPRHYWSHVQRGICRLDVGQPGLAAGDFGTCIGLWPEFAWGHFNRGVCFGRLGRRQEAAEDYSRALERDPEFLPARLNRGLARLEMGHYAAALSDFDEAARRGHDGAALHAGRGGALEGLKRHADADRAFRTALAKSIPAKGAPPAAIEARANLLLQYGFSTSRRLPDRAAWAFGEVRRLRPHNARAAYGEAMLHMAQGELAAARDAFGEAIRLAPDLVEARRFRAIVHARAGDFDAAGRDVNWCLERDDSGPSLFAAACVSALIAAKSSDEADRAEAIQQGRKFLKMAFARGHGRDSAATDPDLAGLRGLTDL